MLVTPIFIQLYYLHISMNQLKAFITKAILLSVVPGVTWAANSSGLEENFKLLDQWVEVEKTTSQEKTDWEVEKQGLLDVIKVYEQEREMLDEKIKEAEEFTSAADSKKSGLLEEQENLRAIESKLELVVSDQEDYLKKLIKRMPTPLREEIAPLAQRIPQDPTKTSLSVSQRLQSIVGILTQVDKFNTSVEIAPEQREFEGGKMVQVTAIYFGLGAAYYADKSGEHAGYGQTNENGWEWVSDVSIAQNVLRLIEMYEGNTTEIEFVPMPVNINK